MPGRLFLTRSKVSALGFVSPELPCRRNMSPGQEICVLTEAGFRMMRWGLIPVGRKNARGRPVMETLVNARSETVFDKSAYAGVRRAAVPVEGWYEWTGQKGKKTAWHIAHKEGALLWFAAIWDVWTAPGGQELAQVATVTCPPNDDLREIHDRMGVVLAESDLKTWISGEEEAARGLMAPLANGQLHLLKDPKVDWSGP